MAWLSIVMYVIACLIGLFLIIYLIATPSTANDTYGHCFHSYYNYCY